MLRRVPCTDHRLDRHRYFSAVAACRHGTVVAWAQWTLDACVGFVPIQWECLVKQRANPHSSGLKHFDVYYFPTPADDRHLTTLLKLATTNHQKLRSMKDVERLRTLMLESGRPDVLDPSEFTFNGQQALDRHNKTPVKARPVHYHSTRIPKNLMIMDDHAKRGERCVCRRPEDDKPYIQ